MDPAQSQALYGRAVRQGPANYAGALRSKQATVPTAPAASTMVRGPGGMGGVDPRLKRPERPLAPPPPQQHAMAQVADRRFYRPETGGPAPVVKQFAPGAIGPKTPTDQQRVFTGQRPATQNMGDSSAAMGAVPQQYSGMMGVGGPQKQKSLLEALGPAQMSAKEDAAGVAPIAHGPYAQGSGPGGLNTFDEGAKAVQGSLAPDKFKNMIEGNLDSWGRQQGANTTGETNGEYFRGNPASTFSADGGLSIMKPETGGGNPVANSFVSTMGDILGGMTGEMNGQDRQALLDYFGPSAGAYTDMMTEGRNMFDPAQRDAWEQGQRDDLNYTVNADKQANLRAAGAARGRGGYSSSNAETGIYGSAAQALSAGERGLTQDRYARDMAAKQAGLSAMGQGASSLQDLLDSGYTSRKELLSLLLTGAEKGSGFLGQLTDLLDGKMG